jgi:deazaflavin-dependent oxidoreductase (nitroreductase family)
VSAGQAQGPAGGGTAGGDLLPVPPALLVRVLLRPMTKLLNPLIKKFAGRRHFRMAAQIHHTGRRSGRSYMTPASAHLHGDVIVIPLTFGNQSDWARNVRAAGGCRIVLGGREYRAVQPEFVAGPAVAPLVRVTFSRMERAGIAMLGIKQFLRLRVAGS